MSTAETPFEHEVARVRAGADAIVPGDGARVEADPETETVTLANGAIVARGVPMIRFLADRLDSISLKRTTARFGHNGEA